MGISDEVDMVVNYIQRNVKGELIDVVVRLSIYYTPHIIFTTHSHFIFNKVINV